MSLIPRPDLYRAIDTALLRSPVTALLGPRQCGKTTMARLFASSPENRFDLESPIDLARLAPNAYGVLAASEGVVVIDEIQQMPELFAHLRVIVDDPLCRARFLVTGSASPDLVSHTAETLAGRTRLLDAGGFTLVETGAEHWARLWFRGGFPRAFQSVDDSASGEWLEDFLKTYVMRDISRLAGGGLTPVALARFLQLVAHYHGQFWNGREAATILGMDVKTVQRYLELMEGAYLVRQVPPYEPNAGKRMRKAHRLYWRDTGLLHSLLRITSPSALRTHDRCGASWEGFGLEQVVRLLKAERACFYWRTHAGAEIDLIVPRGARVLGFEFKVSGSPALSRGVHEAMRDTALDHLYVVHGGDATFEMAEKITAVAMRELVSVLTEKETSE